MRQECFIYTDRRPLRQVGQVAAVDIFVFHIGQRRTVVGIGKEIVVPLQCQLPADRIPHDICIHAVAHGQVVGAIQKHRAVGDTREQDCSLRILHPILCRQQVVNRSHAGRQLAAVILRRNAGFPALERVPQDDCVRGPNPDSGLAVGKQIVVGGRARLALVRNAGFDPLKRAVRHHAVAAAHPNRDRHRPARGGLDGASVQRGAAPAEHKARFATAADMKSRQRCVGILRPDRDPDIPVNRNPRVLQRQRLAPNIDSRRAVPHADANQRPAQIVFPAVMRAGKRQPRAVRHGIVAVLRNRPGFNQFHQLCRGNRNGLVSYRNVRSLTRYIRIRRSRDFRNLRCIRTDRSRFCRARCRAHTVVRPAGNCRHT